MNIAKQNDAHGGAPGFAQRSGRYYWITSRVPGRQSFPGGGWHRSRLAPPVFRAAGDAFRPTVRRDIGQIAFALLPLVGHPGVGPASLHVQELVLQRHGARTKVRRLVRRDLPENSPCGSIAACSPGLVARTDRSFIKTVRENPLAGRSHRVVADHSHRRPSSGLRFALVKPMKTRSPNCRDWTVGRRAVNTMLADTAPTWEWITRKSWMFGFGADRCMPSASDFIGTDHCGFGKATLAWIVCR